jgi:hypothetical protein
VSLNKVDRHDERLEGAFLLCEFRKSAAWVRVLNCSHKLTCGNCSGSFLLFALRFPKIGPVANGMDLFCFHSPVFGTNRNMAIMFDEAKQYQW